MCVLSAQVHADYFYMKGDTDLFAGAEVLESLPCERCQSPGTSHSLYYICCHM
jgi:hypothetical protein